MSVCVSRINDNRKTCIDPRHSYKKMLQWNDKIEVPSKPDNDIKNINDIKIHGKQLFNNINIIIR